MVLPVPLVAALLACNGNKKPPEEASANALAAADAAAAAVEAQAAAAAAEGSADVPEDPLQGMGSEEALAVYRALSVRDPEPDCADIDTLSPTPLQTLLDVIDRASMPPWVPMRAANCVLQRHGAEAQDTLQGWVADDKARGLAILVFDGIDALPEDVALPVAQAGLAGPWSEDAASRLAGSSRPSIVALVPGDSP